MKAHHLRAVLLLSLVRAAVAYVVAAPGVVAVAGAGVQGFPGGDALLFEPGATFLIEALRLSQRQLSGAIEAMLWIAVPALGVLLLALVFLMVALAHEQKLNLGSWAELSFECLPSFVLLAGLTLLLQLAAALLILLVLSLGLGLIPDSSVRARDLGWAATLALAAFAMVLIGVLHDLARAARVSRELDVWEAFRCAAAVTRQRPSSVARAYLLRALGSAIALAVAAAAVAALEVERGGTGRLALVIVIHQTAAFGWALLRADWLRQALSLVRRSPQQLPDDIPVGSAVPAGPTPDPDA